jgi:DNA modification methylase
MIFQGDCLSVLKTLDDNSIDCCVTSPPYWGLRDYGVAGQLGLEKSPDEFVQKLVDVFREVRRVLKDDGTLWLNLGDSYSGSGKGAYKDGVVRLSEKSKKQSTNAGTHIGSFQKVETGLKPKDLVGIPWRVAFALQADGWYLRQDIIWAKPNPMPESVTDRCTKSHEYIFLLSKSPKYYFDHQAIKEPLSQASVSRLSQVNLENQIGSNRVPGKTNGPMKAVYARSSGNKERKQRPSSDILQRGAQAGSIPWEGTTRNKRSVWSVTTKPFKSAHFATFPPDLIEPCILAGCPKNGVVLDPFFGAGTTGLVAKKHGRNYVGIELNFEYIDIAKKRLGIDSDDSIDLL